MSTRLDNQRVVRAPRGTSISAKSWLTEAPLRMLMNNLDPDVAEKPNELVVYGGIGRAARDWEGFDRIVAACGLWKPTKPCWCNPASRSACSARMRCAARADRQFKPRAALGDLEHFNELDRKGLMMYGQMTAGSWIYIGTRASCRGLTKPSSRSGAAIMAAALPANGS